MHKVENVSNAFYKSTFEVLTHSQIETSVFSNYFKWIILQVLVIMLQLQIVFLNQLLSE